jgi:hypothetical protein
MMPQPTSVKLYELDQLYDKAAHRRPRVSAPAPVRVDVEHRDAGRSAGSEGEARLRSVPPRQEPEPISWIDDEAIHQDVIQHEILLAANMDPQIQQLAMERWTQLADQAAAPPLRHSSRSRHNEDCCMNDTTAATSTAAPAAQLHLLPRPRPSRLLLQRPRPRSVAKPRAPRF